MPRIKKELRRLLKSAGAACISIGASISSLSAGVSFIHGVVRVCVKAHIKIQRHNFSVRCRLGIGELLKAPVQIQIASFWIGSRDSRYDLLADAYASLP